MTFVLLNEGLHCLLKINVDGAASILKEEKIKMAVLIEWKSGLHGNTAFANLQSVIARCEKDSIRYEWQDKETLIVWWDSRAVKEPVRYYEESSFRGEIKAKIKGNVAGLLETSLTMYYKGES